MATTKRKAAGTKPATVENAKESTPATMAAELVSVEYTEAVTLHKTIMANAEIIGNALVDICRCLKDMRDKGLYAQLGYESFEDYTEQAVGIKARQAYNYIKTFEELPATVLQAHSGLGITKLQLITTAPTDKRDELLDEAENVSVRELREKIDQMNKDLQSKEEQLSLYQEKAEERDAEATARIEAQTERDRLAAELDEAKKALAELSGKVKAPPTSEELEKERERIEREAQAKIDAAKQEADRAAKEAAKQAEAAAVRKANAARKEGEKDAEKRFKEAMEVMDTEKKAAANRAAALEKQLKVSSDGDTLKFTVFFEAFQEDFNKLRGLILKLRQTRPEDAAKYTAAVEKALEALKKTIQE